MRLNSPAVDRRSEQVTPLTPPNRPFGDAVSGLMMLMFGWLGGEPNHFTSSGAKTAMRISRTTTIPRPSRPCRA